MAGFGAGYDREWLEPLTPEGSRSNMEDDPELGPVMGCHTGTHEWLNIYGGQPGCTYVWERKTGPDMRRSIQKGGQIVKDDDPEMIAAMAAQGGDLPALLGSAQEYNELVLCRYPESATRKIREGEQKKAQEMMRGGADDFLDRVTAAEESAQWNPRGRQTRFAMGEHRIDYMAGDGKSESPQDSWSPSKGIIE